MEDEIKKDNNNLSGFQQSYNSPPEYAGLIVRIIAYVIDAIIVGIAVAIAIFFLLLMTHNTRLYYSSDFFYIHTLISLAIMWLYSAWFESSYTMATPGKRAMGIRVTGQDGQRISFKRAALRFFLKSIIASLINIIGSLLVNYLGTIYTVVDIAVLFTNGKKQCLHDIFARTVVIHGSVSTLEKPTTNNSLVAGKVLIVAFLSLIVLSIVIFYYTQPVAKPDTPPFIINGYIVYDINIENSSGLTAIQKLAAINLSLSSDVVKNFSNNVDPNYSVRSVGPVKLSSEKMIEGNTYYTWSYTNLNSGLLNTSSLLVNVPVYYYMPESNLPLRLLLYVDLTNNRILGYEHEKDPNSTYNHVAEVYCNIPPNSSWYHELRGNYHYLSANNSEIFKVKFNLECFPDDSQYLYPIIVDVESFNTYKEADSYQPFVYRNGYMNDYNQVIDGVQPVPVQIIVNDTAVWHADMSFDPKTYIVMNSSTPYFYTLIIKNENNSRDIPIRFYQIPN